MGSEEDGISKNLLHLSNEVYSVPMKERLILSMFLLPLPLRCTKWEDQLIHYAKPQFF